MNSDASALFRETVLEGLKTLPFAPSVQQTQVPPNLPEMDWEEDEELDERITRTLQSFVPLQPVFIFNVSAEIFSSSQNDKGTLWCLGTAMTASIQI